VRASPDQVFRAWTDYDAWPTFSGLFTKVAVLERAGNSTRIETEVKVMGRKTRRTERHILTPPSQIRVQGEIEDVTNTTLWTFDPVPEGTRVTAVIEAELAGLTKLLGPFAQRTAQGLTREWMEGLAKYVEAKNAQL
jgi:ribosome-associated toxin RatA of RatAB toxin-antitoxin module